ncbi:RidA family protein [Massilia genomosp. 1]|uniref:RidA family protein n=1 Tax=Massilia genomosp. 1 TaxID=2609280 RepID=A0ABX0MNP7_9BURK|nr:RidA family protein [Massilia genomosp. 1]NHZ64412.1 RidA family protein [Massilia genomosp. 1]
MHKKDQAGISFINPIGLYDPQANGYTHVVIASTPARMVYVAGQGGENAAGELAPDFAGQVAQALANLQTALAAADASLEHVVKISVLIVDHSMERLGILGQAMRAAWGERPAPACTLIPVARLALEGMLFEIEATAVAPTINPD